MKRNLSLLGAVLLAAGCSPQQNAPADANARVGSADAACRARTTGPSQLRQDGRYMVDEQGRVVLLHGMNAVWKLKPYFPPDTAAGFSAADADWLRDHGFNSVRLGVLFTGVMPQQGVIDENYLAGVDRVVQLLASRGVYVLFDFHQDMYNEKFGGEGFPDWAVYDDGVPATNQPGFPGTYFTPAVSHTFDNLWLSPQNGNGLWDRYAEAWTAVAAKWKNQDHHGGFDLFNEPYPGSQFATCANPAGCPAFDTQFLQPMQDTARVAIRTVDPSNIVFFEPNFVFNGGAITGLGLAGAPDDANLGFSWHKYCLPGIVLHSQGFTDLPGCDQMHMLVSQNAESAIRDTQLHSTTLVTEFGASDDLADLQQVMKYTDQYNVGWQYWQLKEWGDPTTESQSSGGQGMFAKDDDLSTVKMPKLKILERPYPQATAGTPGTMTYDAATETFSYAYTPRCTGAPTEIYVPKLHYPNGYKVELSGARVISAPNAPILQLDNARDATAVNVKVTPAT